MKLQKVYAISYLMMILIPCDTPIWSLWRTRLQHSPSIDSAPGYHCLVFPNISPASKFYCVTVILPGKMNEIMWDISGVQCLTTAYCPILNPVENKICSFTIFFFFWVFPPLLSPVISLFLMFLIGFHIINETTETNEDTWRLRKSCNLEVMGSNPGVDFNFYIVKCLVISTCSLNFH